MDTENKTPHKRKVDALISWKVTEFEKINRSPKFVLFFSSILFLTTLYGLLTNNLLLSLLLILFGFTFFTLEKRSPQEIIFAVTVEGLFVQDHIYDFESIKSFWIEYTPEGAQELSFRVDQILLPHIRVPLNGTNPVQLRNILLEFLPEKKRSNKITDLLEKI